MIVVCKVCAYLLGGSGGMPSLPPQENFEITSSQIASDAIWGKIPNNILKTHTYVQ